MRRFLAAVAFALAIAGIAGMPIQPAQATVMYQFSLSSGISGADHVKGYMIFENSAFAARSSSPSVGDGGPDTFDGLVYFVFRYIDEAGQTVAFRSTTASKFVADFDFTFAPGDGERLAGSIDIEDNGNRLVGTLNDFLLYTNECDNLTGATECRSMRNPWIMTDIPEPATLALLAGAAGLLALRRRYAA